MSAINTIDTDVLRELLQRSDDMGVLTVYVDCPPIGDPQLEAAAIDLRNRFRELKRRLENDAVRSRFIPELERIWPHVAAVMQPPNAGKSHVLFSGLSDRWFAQFESPLQVNTRMVLDDGPFIHPLLELFDNGQPIGVVLVSSVGAQLLHWHLGSLDPIEELTLEYTQASHERAGQIGGGPPGQYHTPMREQRQTREQTRMKRFVHDVAASVEKNSAGRNWQRILVSAGQRWTDTMISALSPSLRSIAVADSRDLNGLGRTALNAAVTEFVHADNSQRQHGLLKQVGQAAQTGTVAVGLAEVTAALNAGRAANLIYDPGVRFTGYVTSEGTLYEHIPTDFESTAPDPRFTERLVERALATGAKISPVSGAAQGELADGIAAILRW